MPNNKAYLKLAIPGDSLFVRGQNAWERTASIQEKYLIDRFENHEFFIRQEGERQKVSGEFEDPFFETTFLVETASDGGFDASLFRAIDEFVNGIKNIDKCDRASVLLHCPELFDKKLICEPKSLATSKVMFGNIYQNEFYNHWQISFDQQIALSPGPKPSYGQHIIHQLVSEFTFDKPQSLTVEYCTNGKIKRQQIVQKTKLSLDGSSIQKIIVDMSFRVRQDDRPKTRIYFLLTSPIRAFGADLDNNLIPSKYKRALDLYWGADRKMFACREVLTENPIFCVEFKNHIDFCEIYTIISRLHHRWDSIPIEFSKIENYRQNLFESDLYTNYATWTNYRKSDTDSETNIYDHLLFNFLRNVFPNPPHTPGVRNKAADENNERKFTYTYLIMSLLSRGAVVKDQLLLSADSWHQFLCIIGRHYDDDEKHYLCEAALEDLLCHVDQTQPRVGNLHRTLVRFCEAREQSGESNQITPEDWKMGFRKVRKVILTPTRMLFMIPETIMGNRALSGVDHDGTRVIRSVFRDDDGQPMRVTFLRKLLRDTVIKWFREGFKIMDREFGFLGCSNSQMRDGGAYFMERFSNSQRKAYRDRFGVFPPFSFKPKILEYRDKLGKFEELESIPKVLARMGQCFTQARECYGVNIRLDDYQLIGDTIGGKNKTGDCYTFTDGIGTISVALATRIAESLGLPKRFVPCAFQIRFRGFKGMLVVDPGLDEAAEQFTILYRQGAIHNQDAMTGDEKVDLVPWIKQIIFRDSQLKFKDATRGKTEWPIEIVKWSVPSPVSLNRPFINVLDQVSASQSLECHKRVISRIEELKDIQTTQFAKCMFNEESCRSKLAEMPRRIHFAALERRWGFHVSTEPFFLAVVKAWIDCEIMRLRSKIQIQVPAHLGRTMFGVIDESGQLQPGQVFVKYTTNIDVKQPSEMSNFEILIGDVMITKFPTVVEGDVRKFTAVDIPELHHLVNVVVFPKTGPRPHPDEMAGSDLDGDEYAVIWDKKLFLERNEDAFEYCSEKPPNAFTKQEMDEKMHEFVAMYMENDSVGQISTNHLHQSDQFGLTSPVCQTLAMKNSQALDFSKSGVPPKPLTSRWEHNPDTQTWNPPERTERVPDYSRPGFIPTYTSSRILGTIHRELRSIQDVIVASAERQVEVVVDPMLAWNGWQDYIPAVEAAMSKYNSSIRSLMDNYGIKTEAELISGCFRELRCRISDRESDDMSLFNTEMIIERKMTKIFRDHREEFFEEFRVPNTDPSEKAFKRLTQPINDWESDEQEDVLRRVCTLPSEKMMAKATAYYKVCYEKAADANEKRLSFAWIAFDILNYVKSKNVLESEVMPDQGDPQLNAITTHRQMYIQENHQKFKEFQRRIHSVQIEDEHEEEARKIIRNYIEMYPHLVEYLFIIEMWARAARVLHVETEGDSRDSPEAVRDNLKNSAASRMKWYHLALMVIMFAAKRIGSLGEVDPNNGHAILDILPPQFDPTNKHSLSDADLDHLTVAFFLYLSSREFKRAKSLSFKSIGFSSVFLRGEWLEYHKSAIKTHFNLMLNMRLDELPLESESIVRRRNVVKEGAPFIVDLPTGVDVNEIVEALRRKSRCVEIQARLENTSIKIFDRVLISCRGTAEAINALRDLVAIQMPRYSWQLDDTMSKNFVHMCYYRITGKEFKLGRKESNSSGEEPVRHPLQRVPSNYLRNRARRVNPNDNARNFRNYNVNPRFRNQNVDNVENYYYYNNYNYNHNYNYNNY